MSGRRGLGAERGGRAADRSDPRDAENFDCYGYPRVWHELRHQGEPVGRDHVARLMRQEGIRSDAPDRLSDGEIAAVERLIAKQALSWPQIRRLMTVPGVNLVCAATFIATVGEPSRFLSSRKLGAYLGLDPRVKQSGEGPARSRRISKRGSPAARWALVETCMSVVLQPGPMRAFYERVRGRRGHGKAIVATARKLAILFWCMLTRGEDYAHQQPSLTRKKLRRLEITAGATKNTRKAAGVWSTNELMRTAERELATQAESSYRPMVNDQLAGRPAKKVGASATPERA